MVWGLPDVRVVHPLIDRIDCRHRPWISFLQGRPETSHVVIRYRIIGRKRDIVLLQPLTKHHLLLKRQSSKIVTLDSIFAVALHVLPKLRDVLVFSHGPESRSRCCRSRRNEPPRQDRSWRSFP